MKDTVENTFTPSKAANNSSVDEVLSKLGTGELKPDEANTSGGSQPPADEG